MVSLSAAQLAGKRWEDETSGSAQLFGGLAYQGQTFDRKTLEKMFKEAQRGK